MSSALCAAVPKECSLGSGIQTDLSVENSRVSVFYDVQPHGMHRDSLHSVELN